MYSEEQIESDVAIFRTTEKNSLEPYPRFSLLGDVSVCTSERFPFTFVLIKIQNRFKPVQEQINLMRQLNLHQILLVRREIG